MRRRLRNTVISFIFVVTAVNLFATESGIPGLPLGNMEFSAGSGFGYIYRPLQNPDNYVDAISSFQMILKGGMGITDYINIFIFGGLNDARKKIGNFRGVLSPFYGLSLRLIPLNENFTFINLAFEVAAEYSKISGSEANLYWTKIDAKLSVSKLFSEIFGFYGGVKYSYHFIKLSSLSERSRSVTPWGIFIGMDYFVTPYIFFEAEMHNFDQDALFLMVGSKF